MNAPSKRISPHCGTAGTEPKQAGNILLKLPQRDPNQIFTYVLRLCYRLQSLKVTAILYVEEKSSTQTRFYHQEQSYFDIDSLIQFMNRLQLQLLFSHFKINVFSVGPLKGEHNLAILRKCAKNHFSLFFTGNILQKSLSASSHN